MIGQVSFLLALASTAVCQQISFVPSTGTRSLWIPYQTISGTPLASIPVVDTTATTTIYILSCPTDQPNCPLSPRLTLTEGPTTIRYTARNAAGYAILECQAPNTETATCAQYGSANGQLYRSKPSTLYGDEIDYQPVSVTSIKSIATSVSTTIDTTTATITTTMTETSTGGGAAAGVTGGAWYFGGAVGAGLVAIAAL